MKTKHNVDLDVAELGSIWTSYINDTLAVCVFKHFLSNIDDIEIKSLLEYALLLSQAHIKKLKALFNEEGIAIPVGFNGNDVNEDAPRLFTDDFYLFYLHKMAKTGMLGYTLVLANTARLDLAKYYTECLNESANLCNKASEVLLNKGTYMRAPLIPKPINVGFVKKESYLTGWFGNRRPMNAIEISNIYYNLIRNQIGQVLVTGFSQVAKSQQLRKYMVKARDISAKHIEIFGSLLSEDKLPTTSTWSALPTTSTVAPFSDKLMLFHASALSAAGIGQYGSALGTSQRRDLGATYTRLIAEILEFAEEGANIMIDNGWMEQPPQAPDRDSLANV